MNFICAPPPNVDVMSNKQPPGANQSISAGSHSQNNQAGRDVVNNNITYAPATDAVSRIKVPTSEEVEQYDPRMRRIREVAEQSLRFTVRLAKYTFAAAFACGVAVSLLATYAQWKPVDGWVRWLQGPSEAQAQLQAETARSIAALRACGNIVDGTTFGLDLAPVNQAENGACLTNQSYPVLTPFTWTDQRTLYLPTHRAASVSWPTPNL
jgi:hypothetical protein